MDFICARKTSRRVVLAPHLEGVAGDLVVEESDEDQEVAVGLPRGVVLRMALGNFDDVDPASFVSPMRVSDAKCPKVSPLTVPESSQDGFGGGHMGELLTGRGRTGERVEEFEEVD